MDNNILKEIRNKLSIEDIYSILQKWGGEPIYTDFGIIAHTICHNLPGAGSAKLYYYSNSRLFICYTQGCGNQNGFDIFELAQKVFKVQRNQDISLYSAIYYIANYFGYQIDYTKTTEDNEILDDWKIFSNYEKLNTLENRKQDFVLKEYDKQVLNYFNYDLKLTPWLQEGITQEVIDFAKIGYYLGDDQITIPHFDINGKLIGIRGRTICSQEAEIYGKYRPLRLNQMLYNHPLGLNLYGLNWAKDNIKNIKSAIVMEGEKSVLKMMSYFGIDNCITVAACGSSLSHTQIQLLLDLGTEEIIVSFDKQYPALNTPESKAWSNKLIKLRNKYKNDCLISFIWDKSNILDYKESPIDKGPDKFLKLYKERVIL